ncbi:hypothetical protein [Methylobacterium sp. WL1]|uniref:hypothetical protein n=1 Tax=Methylobacterium sp. WL1 TaxID=2603276 RepID=UPI0011C1F79C|nr:hypothetical protein [Methylobacterium sp. WL1]QEE40866.1 hypothetical protein FVA80_19655 [Methylobacterium sp. WL1]
MRSFDALPSERRALAEQLLRETALTLDEISARTGVKPATISTWNARSGWLRPRRWRQDVVTRWPEARRRRSAASSARRRTIPATSPGGRDRARRRPPADGGLRRGPARAAGRART